MRTELILALDLESAEKAKQFITPLKGLIRWIKIGSQLFVSEGPKVLELVKSNGFKIFLDLKLHDIPNTVAHTVARMKSFGVDMITVHTTGGREMLTQAKKEAGENIKVLGVTVLTSLSDDDLRIIGVNQRLSEQVLTLARLAKDCGIDGVVCSPQEAKSLRNSVGDDFIIVTPGIRLDKNKMDDQKRSLSPAELRELSINYIVVGRPILKAEDPVGVVRRILETLT